MNTETLDRINTLQQTSKELTDLCNEVIAESEKLRNDIENENCCISAEERKAVEEASKKIEERIRKENGGKMHTKSKIKTYHIGDEIVVRLDDVLELCRIMKMKYRKGTEKGYICDDEKARIHAFLALNHLQTTLLSDELSKVDDIDSHKKIIEVHAGKKKPLEIPPRYAVGKKYDEEHDYWMFFVKEENDKPIFSNRPCMAMRYMRYKDAEACRDFLDDGDWDVIDMWNALSPDQRLQRQLFGETEWDDGMENAIRLSFE